MPIKWYLVAWNLRFVWDWWWLDLELEYEFKKYGYNHYRRCRLFRSKSKLPTRFEWIWVNKSSWVDFANRNICSNQFVGSLANWLITCRRLSHCNGYDKWMGKFMWYKSIFYNYWRAEHNCSLHGAVFSQYLYFPLCKYFCSSFSTLFFKSKNIRTCWK